MGVAILIAAAVVVAGSIVLVAGLLWAGRRSDDESERLFREDGDQT